MAPVKIPPETEAQVQRKVTAYLDLMGFWVYSTSQGYRPDPGGTRMTPGLPDLVVFLPQRLGVGFFEVKTPAGQKEMDRMLALDPLAVKPSQRKKWQKAHHQHLFGVRCQGAGIPYARGGLTEAIAWASAIWTTPNQRKEP